MSKVKSQKYVFMGSPAFASTILDGLLESGWIPTLIITEPPKPVGRKQVLTPTAVQTFAEAHGLPVATPSTKDELLSILRCHPRADSPQRNRHQGSSTTDQIPARRSGGLRPSFASSYGRAQQAQDDTVKVDELDLIVVAAYGRILTQAMLDIPKYGAVNVHASLLPKYRGASPIQAALLAGEVETGVTFMRMEAGLDTGPAIAKFPVSIQPNETTVSLTAKLATTAAQHIASVLENYVSYMTNGTYSTYLSTQDDSQATYAPKLAKEDGVVELASVDPVKLDRMVRALNPWPGVVTTEFGESLKILEGVLQVKSSVIASKAKQSGPDRHGRALPRDDKEYYTITKLQWAGKQPVDGATFARAYPDILTKLPPSIKLGATHTSY